MGGKHLMHFQSENIVVKWTGPKCEVLIRHTCNREKKRKWQKSVRLSDRPCRKNPVRDTGNARGFAWESLRGTKTLFCGRGFFFSPLRSTNSKTTHYFQQVHMLLSPVILLFSSSLLRRGSKGFFGWGGSAE